MCNHQNHNGKRIKEIDLRKSFLEQDFQTEDCENKKFVPFKCLRINTVEQLYFLFKEMFSQEKESQFLYRGQSNADWFLDCTLEREVEKYSIPICTQEIEKKVFHNFKMNLRGKLTDQSLLKITHIDDERELWAIGRHYDLKTPLMDWSSSLYVALFMAFSETKENNEISDYSAVFIVNSKFFPECSTFSNRYWFTPTTDYYGRITAQKGFLSHYSIREHIKEKLNQGYLCAFKIYIKSDLRNEILAYLKHIGIEYTTMYPDLLGAVKFANNELKEYLIKRTPSNK
ncbi:MAG: FRG domain-containing protein [Pasteurellaceae bacterium]|nr:FRG domain-containing protein [Pasteurellaceae bacterium]